MERPVVLFEGERVVKCFSNIKSASENLGISRGGVTARCNGKTKSSPTLKWYYDVPHEQTKAMTKWQRPCFRGMEEEVAQMEKELTRELVKIVSNYRFGSLENNT
jgi:hypothetical protein